MLDITLFILVSKDGYIADAQGNVDELISTKQQEDYGFTNFYKTTNGIVMGSNTYAQITNYGPWPYADKKTYVFSHKDLKLQPKVEVVQTDVDQFLASKNQVNKVLHFWLVGGAKLITSFYNQSAIQNYILTIIPKDLKAGVLLPKAIWDGVGMKKYETKRYFDGVVQDFYKSL